MRQCHFPEVLPLRKQLMVKVFVTIYSLVGTITALCLLSVFRCGCFATMEGISRPTSAPMVLNCEEADFSNIHMAMALVHAVRKLIDTGAEPSETGKQLLLYINAYRRGVGETKKTWLEWHCAITNAVGSSGKLYYFNCEWVVKNGGNIFSFDDLLCVPRDRNVYHFDKLHCVDPRIFQMHNERQFRIIDFTMESIDKISEAIGPGFVENKIQLLETLLEIESECEDITLRGKPWFEDLKRQLEEYGLDQYNESGSCRLYFSSNGNEVEFIIRRGPFVMKRIRCDNCDHYAARHI